jgi:hypothetical protein
MYLTTALLAQGYAVRCPKPGPDAGIVVDGRRICFEATSPTRGADGTADHGTPLRSKPPSITQGL